MDGENWTDWEPWTPEGTYRIPQDGPTTVSVQPRAHRGTLGPVASDSIVLDSTAPMLKPPKARLVTGVLGSSDRPIPVEVSWKISDATSGLTEAAIHADCGSGKFLVSDRTDPGPSGGFAAQSFLAAGRRCLLSAKAVDAAGNEVTIDGKPGYRTRKVEETPTSRLVYWGNWINRIVPRADGGSVQMGTAAAPGKPATRLTFTFSGNDIAIVSRVGPSRGRARLTIDGHV